MNLLQTELVLTRAVMLTVDFEQSRLPDAGSLAAKMKMPSDQKPRIAGNRISILRLRSPKFSRNIHRLVQFNTTILYVCAMLLLQAFRIQVTAQPGSQQPVAVTWGVHPQPGEREGANAVVDETKQRSNRIFKQKNGWKCITGNTSLTSATTLIFAVFITVF